MRPSLAGWIWWTLPAPGRHTLGLAGLWNAWGDKATGEVHDSYTLLTINADSHPFMTRMHKPDPKLPNDQQDKRNVIAIEMEDVDRWLGGTQADAQTLLLGPPRAG